MGNPILVGFKRITDTVAGLIARDTSGNEFTICDTDGYLYQNDTKVTETASNINAVGDLITEVQTARGGEVDLNTRLGGVDTQLAQKANIAQEAWIAPTLMNSWVNYGASESTAGYYKDTLGRVHLKGLLKSGTTTTWTTLFALPAGYRPAQNLTYTIPCNTGNAQLAVQTGGSVTLGNASSNTYISLSGISFIGT